MEELWRENNIFYNILCFVITENEKLFDRNEANLYWRTVFHVMGICHHAYVAMMATGDMGHQIMSHKDPVVQSLYNFRGAYLTGWNFIFQTIFLGLSLGHDILEWLDKQDSYLGKKIKYWRNVMYNGMVVPFTLFVTGMFWCIYAIDRELVFPKIYDEVVPWWFNQCVHTNITIMIIIETLLQARRYPTDEKMETIVHTFVAVLYAIVYYSIYYVTRRWLYQVFGIMTWWQVCLFQLLIWSSCYVFYKIHFPINRLVHGAEDSAEDKLRKNVSEESKDRVDSNGIGANGNGVGTDGNGVGTNGINDNDTNIGNNDKIAMDLKDSPFSAKSWSVKYRSIRNQFEKSHL